MKWKAGSLEFGRQGIAIRFEKTSEGEIEVVMFGGDVEGQPRIDLSPADGADLIKWIEKNTKGHS